MKTKKRRDETIRRKKKRVTLHPKFEKAKTGRMKITWDGHDSLVQLVLFRCLWSYLGIVRTVSVGGLGPCREAEKKPDGAVALTVHYNPGGYLIFEIRFNTREFLFLLLREPGPGRVWWHQKRLKLVINMYGEFARKSEDIFQHDDGIATLAGGQRKKRSRRLNSPVLRFCNRSIPPRGHVALKISEPFDDHTTDDTAQAGGQAADF